MVEIREYQDRSGRSPFQNWFNRLNAEAARKVTTALYRLSLGNVSHVQSVGSGTNELKINFGPGYRVYFGRDGQRIVVLLAGGTKQRQEKDIQLAIALWESYKRGENQKEEE
jgi:putative addiction module killer protein